MRVHIQWRMYIETKILSEPLGVQGIYMWRSLEDHSNVWHEYLLCPQVFDIMSARYISVELDRLRQEYSTYSLDSTHQITLLFVDIYWHVRNTIQLMIISSLSVRRNVSVIKLKYLCMLYTLFSVKFFILLTLKSLIL